MEEKKAKKQELDKDEKKKEANAFIRLKDRMSKGSKGKSRMKSESDENVTVDITDASKEKDDVTRSIKESSKLNESNYVNGDNMSMRKKKK